ncbi:transmembrane protein 222-like [Lineus longissimus]|uniref:transmembrane protein 222-like n=1 Tax=Lineus longissimus TaxID=88925 RepID=UPI002B4E6409
MADVENSQNWEKNRRQSGASDNSMTQSLPLFDAHKVDASKSRFPHCVVWTPIPMLTWLFPFIGHMGIATTSGVIRDFAGPYYVSEDCMAFGNPTKYWQLSLGKVKNGRENWDRSVHEASEEYKTRMHNLCCDNCHSHCAYALNSMNYEGSSNWNMIKLCFLMLVHSKYVSCAGFVKTWLPFLILVAIVIVTVCAVELTGKSSNPH